MTKHILILGFVFPEPGSSAAGSRMLQLIRMFQEKDWKITFASPAAHSDFAFDLTTIGVEQVSIRLNDASFDHFIKVLNPSIVMFDRFMMEEQFGWRVAENCPDALRILDTEDLHSLRLARQHAFKENREFETKDLFSEVAKREIASILRCDLTLMISEFEMELLQKQFRVDPSLLFYLPLMLDDLEETSRWKPFENREHFVFIGNFLHEPNWNAVLFLKESIWPLIRKALPAAELHIYGAYPPQKALNLNNPQQGFLVKGRAVSAAEVMKNARICLAPLRFGAGIKGKLLEAMQFGTPSITTEIGAESMYDDLPWNGTIENDPHKLANAAVALYQDQKEWEKAQQNGLEIIRQRYLKSIFEDRFIDLIIHLQENLENHRQNNFLGAMLMHHSLASTKYMSRWIEEKNRN